MCFSEKCGWMAFETNQENLSSPATPFQITFGKQQQVLPRFDRWCNTLLFGEAFPVPTVRFKWCMVSKPSTTRCFDLRFDSPTASRRHQSLQVVKENLSRQSQLLQRRLAGKASRWNTHCGDATSKLNQREPGMFNLAFKKRHSRKTIHGGKVKFRGPKSSMRHSRVPQQIGPVIAKPLPVLKPRFLTQ